MTNGGAPVEPPARVDGCLDPRLDALPCGFVAFDDSGAIRAVNATLRAMLAGDADAPDAAAPGLPVEGLLTRAARVLWHTHVLPQLRMQGRVQELYLPLRRADGTELPCLVNAVRHAHGASAITDCVVVSVWERRQFEEALVAARRAADEARDKADAHRFELTAANELLEAQQLELEMANQQMQEQAVELEMQAEVLAGAAAELESESTAAEAARRAAEAARAVAEAERARADAANATKAQFLATMSHELRTPLNAIGGYTQLLELEVHGPVTDAQRVALARVQTAQRHLLGLINDVLNYAKLEAGRVEYALGAVDLRTVVAEVVPLLEPQLAAKGVALHVRLPDGPCEVWADREKLGQVLVNLLSNATKFTEARHPATGAPGRVTIDVATRASVGQVFLRVSDTGRGVARAQQHRIFEPFVQVHAGYAHPDGGTGLGLSISRDLARGMGGDLRVRSGQGEGSTFTVALRPA